MADLHGNSKLPECEKTILIEIARGNSRNGAAKAAGIRPNTLSDWMRRGLEEGEDGPYHEFAATVARLEGELEGDLVEQVRRDDPKYVLATRFRNWSPRQEVTGADGAPLVMNFHEPNPQERNGVPHTNGRVTVERR